ncbi:phosphatase PAP2 family protein [Candidatus Micrarchaeota archaeon]|nr:phosphatase PAP2 family protein [Candidatus Micrarchaeota archaeon]MBD3417673.1 phosphatase PAP2 family protein [Candidatus Micrarchaeota archaeon]
MDLLISALTQIFLLLGNEVIFFIVVGALLFFFEKRPEKRKKIILGIIVVSLMVIALKNLFALERPCTGIEAEYGCPAFPLMEYSFPSGHSAVAFLLMIAFLDKKSFPVFWLFAFFIAVSRFYLGVHTFEDIAGALVLAPIAYHATDVLWGRYVA